MKRLFLLPVIFLLPFCLYSQVDLGLPNITGKGGVANGVSYDWECLGINPANLGWRENHKFSMTGPVFGLSVQSGALDYKQLNGAVWKPNDTFSLADKEQYAKIFSNAEGLNLNSNFTWLAASLRIPKVGGVALNVRDRAMANVKLNKNAAEILFLGMQAPVFKDTLFWLNPQNISDVFSGSEIGFMRYRELNLAYGAKLLGIGGTPDSSAFAIFGGIGFKYLWGLGDFEMIAENNVLTGHSAFASKYNINYGNIKNFTPEETSGLFGAAGSGTAIDLGAGVGFGKFKITASAVDIGKINWTKNILVAQDTLLPDTSQFNFSGINSWNIVEHTQSLFNDSGIVQFEPGNAYSTTLPSKFRFGIGWQISKRMVAGADLVMPMSKNPANLDNAFYAVGTEIELAEDFKFAFGFAGNSTYKFALPFGVTLGHFFEVLEVRLATNDLLTYLSPGEHPNISFSVSFFRFDSEPKKSE